MLIAKQSAVFHLQERPEIKRRGNQPAFHPLGKYILVIQRFFDRTVFNIFSNTDQLAEDVIWFMKVKD